MYRIVIPIIVAAFFITGCNSSEDSSPFSEILSQSPYKAITDSIKKDPDSDELYFRRAILLNKNNLPEPALADFKKAWSLKKQESYALGTANLLLAKNKDEAIDFMQEAFRDLPNSVLLLMGLAHAYDEQNKTDEALDVCNTILQNNPDFVSALVLQADLLKKKGDINGSTSALEKANKYAPGDADISFKLAYQYAENKNAKVIPFADSLIKRDTLKLHPEPYYIEGIYYSNIDNKEKALQYFNETIKLNYNYLNAYIEKGKILLDQKKMADALNTFQLANTISPSFPDAWYWIGRCQEEMGNKKDAKLSYQKAFGLDKTFTEAKEAAKNIK